MFVVVLVIAVVEVASGEIVEVTTDAERVVRVVDEFKYNVV